MPAAAFQAALQALGGLMPGKRGLKAGGRQDCLPHFSKEIVEEGTQGRMPSVSDFRAKIEGVPKGRAYIVLPFKPADVWGSRPRYHVTGTINGRGVRGALEKFAKGYFLPLGPAYRRGAGLELGEDVTVVLTAEGPQRENLAADIVAALKAEPKAEQFFDGLASFYRKKYLRWIDATKRSPEVRAERITEFVQLLKAGEKQRPT